MGSIASTAGDLAVPAWGQWLRSRTMGSWEESAKSVFWEDAARRRKQEWLSLF